MTPSILHERRSQVAVGPVSPAETSTPFGFDTGAINPLDFFDTDARCLHRELLAWPKIGIVERMLIALGYGGQGAG